MLRIIAVAIRIASASLPSEGQVFNEMDLDRLDRRLCGRVVDHTANHGRDGRIESPIRYL